MRILAELVAALRAACGADFIVGLKLPGDDGMPGGIGPDEAGIVGDLLTRRRTLTTFVSPAARTPALWRCIRRTGTAHRCRTCRSSRSCVTG